MIAIAAGAASAVVAAAIAGPAGAQDFAAWRGFEAVLWVDAAGGREDAFWEAVAEAGFTAVSASRGTDVGRPVRHGLRFYADQIAGKGVLELRDAQWDPLFERYLEDRDDSALVRPSCLADDATLAHLAEAVDRGLDGLLPRGPIAASLADEASATRRCNPLDVCASDAFRAAFLAHLRARHAGDLAALNERWGTSYGAWEQVHPWTTRRMRARELIGPVLPRNLAPWSDQLDFTEELFARAVRHAAEAVRRRAPGLPTGLTGMQPPTAFGGHDFARLVPPMRFYEVYDICGARDLADCLARPDALEVATLFPSDAEEPPEMVDARLGSMVAHGMSGVIVWSASDAFGVGAEPTAYGRRVAASLRRLRAASSVFAGARIERSPVLLVESRPSVRAHWMLDSWVDGDTWPRRLSSYEAEHGTSMQARRSWVTLLTDLGLQPDFVDARDLPQRLQDAPPRLLVFPACLALSDEAVAAVRAYVEDGGHALADHGLALYDDALRLRATPALDALFGLTGRGARRDVHLVRNAEGSGTARLASGVAVAERGVQGELGEVVGESAGMVQIEASPGRGRTTFLNLAVCEYAGIRLSPERVAAARDLRRRVQRALDAAGVAPSVLVRGEGLPTCVERIPLRARDGGRLLAVRLDALDDPDLMRLLGARGSRAVDVVFREPVRVRDVLTDSELSPADGGDGRVFRAELSAWQPLFLEVSPR